jgi:hypothetical protein
MFLADVTYYIMLVYFVYIFKFKISFNAIAYDYIDDKIRHALRPKVTR